MTDLPPVKPSAIALGIAFTQISSAAILAPLFGDTYHRAQAANSKEEFFKSKESATAAAAWGGSILGSGIQTYGVAALINATGTLSYKGSAYLGSLIFFASAGPGVSHIRVLKQNIILTITSSSHKSSLKSDLSTSLPSVFCPVSSRLSASACSLHTGAPEPTLLTSSRPETAGCRE